MLASWTVNRSIS